MRRVLALTLLLLVRLAAAPAGAADDPGRAAQWGLDRIGVPRGSGDGVVVAVIDSGVDLEHVDLRDRIVPGIDLVDDDSVPQDANGHGTHVAGIVAATAGNGAGIAGVAPMASIMPIRVLDADGEGTLTDVVAGVQWAVAHGADVVNLSLSEDAQAILGPQLSDALRDAWDKGVVPVIAAGNQYVLGSGFADEPALVVSATTRENGKPSYSSAVGAAKWGIAAPGGEQPVLGESGAILSTYWVEGQSDQYAYDCGTSMAAPHVAGAAAVLRGLGLSPAETVDRLLATATDIGASGRDDVFGAGLLNLAAASDGIDPGNDPGADGSSPPTTTTPSTPSTTSGAAPATTTTTAPSGASTTTSTTATPVTVPAGSEDEDGTAAPGSTDDDDPSTTVPGLLAAVLAAGAAAGAIAARRRLT